MNLRPGLTTNPIPQIMKTSKRGSIARVPRAVILFNRVSLLVGLTLSFSCSVWAENTAKKFASLEEAVAALRQATDAADTNALMAILGPAAVDLQNPDRIQSTNELETFSSALGKTNRLVRVSDTFVVLELGEDLWPFPIPIVKQDGAWFFDTEVGKDELLNRRIGNNELAILPVMRAYVDAQREYASIDHDDDQVLEYAQRLISSPGKHDGLYWPPDSVGGLSPLGPLVAYAQAEGYGPELREEDEAERGPYQGYYFKILTRQGKRTPGGKYNYVTNGNMIGGFAMVAWPAEYGSSGVVTFIVNQQGRVYQKDFGPSTSRIAHKMSVYDLDPTWMLSRE
jgi:hypothetical protein